MASPLLRYLSAMKLRGVRLFLGQQRMDAFVESDAGTVHQVEYRWLAKDASDLPPEGWEETVFSELRLQQRALPERDILSRFRKRK